MSWFGVGGAEVPEASDWRLGLGHRRLAIIEASDAGAQPMRRGTIWAAWNGEIYNHPALRRELASAGARFEGRTDTEVLLAGWEHWGHDCFRRFKGMWAVVLFDTARRTLVVSRDRLGIKPLYRGSTPALTAFVSEPKQLRGVVSLAPNREALRDWLETGWEDPTQTLFEAITPIAPGTWEEWSIQSGQRVGGGQFWAPEHVVATVHSPKVAAGLLTERLRVAVEEHQLADVQVGVALSGGLDSSAVAAFAGGEGLRSFTAAFPGLPADDGPFAAAVARHLRLKAFVTTPGPESLIEELDAFVIAHDEPVGSLGQFAGWCVARLARESGAKVVLTGQGGDEALGGYWQSYLVDLWRGPRRAGAKELLASLLWGNREPYRQAPAMWRRYLSRRSSPADLAAVTTGTAQQRRLHELRWLHLPRLLKWDDRNFMAFSVEARSPFLDHELIETALTFAPGALHRAGWLKEPLRLAAAPLLPRTIVRRRDKAGFEVPERAWLAGCLRGPIEALLRSDGLLWTLASRARARGLRAGVLEDRQALVRHFFADRWLQLFCLTATVGSTGAA